MSEQMNLQTATDKQLVEALEAAHAAPDDVDWFDTVDTDVMTRIRAEQDRRRQARHHVPALVGFDGMSGEYEMWTIYDGNHTTMTAFFVPPEGRDDAARRAVCQAELDELAARTEGYLPDGEMMPYHVPATDAATLVWER